MISTMSSTSAPAETPRTSGKFFISCRIVPMDQFFTTHIDKSWSIPELKIHLLSKALGPPAPRPPGFTVAQATEQESHKGGSPVRVPPNLKVQVPIKKPSRSPSNASQRGKISIITVPPKSPTSSQPSSSQPSPRAISFAHDFSTSPHRQYSSMAVPPASPVLEDSDESGSLVFADDPDYDWTSANDHELESPIDSPVSPISDRHAPLIVVLRH
ncbi:uncharacterized protein EI90DRAFT_672846 [Cantharellus anzutake]|uniref:uncharacterized protein n=1 Tax=Cantharellus anzutake TaxID=1750568 RepID=UPI001905BB6B|nr:uncharacterized protein EI90DRAFT_672846 [Cantharellus anzutake]KAF8332592.1 hypothetical protein EI90DRAFT_672846 [Cantharellus anzutake]